MADDERLIYWVDRCLGADLLPSALEKLGVEVERYVETYPHDPAVPDTTWIRDVTARGLVIVTKDKNIRRDAIERAVLVAAKARYVCLATARMTGEQQAECLVRNWRTIEGVLRTRTPPVLVNVTRDGVDWLDGGSWRRIKHKPTRL